MFVFFIFLSQCCVLFSVSRIPSGRTFYLWNLLILLSFVIFCYLSMANITISSLNVRGLGNNKKRRETFQWLRKKNYSIYMLQEVHCTEKSFETWAAEWGYTALFNGLATNKAGVAILLITTSLSKF